MSKPERCRVRRHDIDFCISLSFHPSVSTPSTVRFEIAAWQIYDKPIVNYRTYRFKSTSRFIFSMIDRRQSVVEGAKTERKRKVGWRGRRVTVVWLCRIGMKWQNHKKKYILHRPSLPRHPFQLRWRLVSRNDFASRAEIFVPSSPAIRCPTVLSSPLPPGHCFYPLWRAGQRGNISSFEGFNVFRNFDRHVLLVAVTGRDGREMMDSVKLNDGSRHLFSTWAFFLPLVKTSNE